MKILQILKQWFGSASAPQKPDISTPVARTHHPLDETRDEDAYREALSAILAAQSDQASAALRGLCAAFPAKATGINIMVHPSQDPDGVFGVMVHLDGPDLYVLNKSVAEFRSLFDTVMTPAGRVPRLPMFDPFDTAFEVNDVIVDVAADWVDDIWIDAGGPETDVPAYVVGDEGYGKRTPRALQNKATT